MLVITGWRIGPGGVALATLALSCVVVWQSGQHLGPFSAFEPDPVRRLLLIQAYLVIVVGPSLLLALVEREALEASTQLREIVDHSSEAIFLLDARDREHLRYEALNRAAEIATGFSSVAVRGHTAHEVLPREDADRATANYLRCLDADGTISYEQTLTLAGSTRTWSTSLVPIRDASGKIVRIAGFSRDLTEQQQQETARAALEAQLRQAQKMEAIGRLAGGLAHDFNNILTAIIGHGELLAESAPPGSRGRESADAVLEAGRRASALVRQVLTFARRQEQPRRPIELSTVLNEVMRLARAMVPATIDVRLSVDSRAPRVLADPTQIHQALMNLISNAAYAMREQGGLLTVLLDTSVVDEEFARLHAPLPPGLAVCLTVADTGTGMDAGTLEHVYEPFFTTKPVGEGTGLGLPVVMGIVQNHEGGLAIESQPGRGTTVRIFLPAAAESPAVPPVETAAATPLGHGQRVLLVDDEAAVAGIGARLLESLGYHVTVFNQPDRALERFLQDPSRFDLLLTDLTMPVMTGAVLARQMRRHRPDLRVVIVTGVPSAVADQSFAVLAKPYTRHTLGLAVAAVVDPVA
jgi:PAS domain S-box-containing protein